MANWDDQFKQLKSQFVSRSGNRLAEMAKLVDSLTGDPENQDVVRQLRQHFHWLSGSGGTYGFDEVTSWGIYGEELCDYLLTVGMTLSATDLEQLKSALTVLTQLLVPSGVPTTSLASSDSPAPGAFAEPSAVSSAASAIAAPSAASAAALTSPAKDNQSANFLDNSIAFPPPPAAGEAVEPPLNPPLTSPMNSPQNSPMDSPMSSPAPFTSMPTEDFPVLPPGQNAMPPTTSILSPDHNPPLTQTPPASGAEQYPPPAPLSTKAQLTAHALAALQQLPQAQPPLQPLPPLQALQQQQQHPIQQNPAQQEPQYPASTPEPISTPSPAFTQSSSPTPTPVTPAPASPVPIVMPPQMRTHIDNRSSIVVADGNLTNLGIMKKELESHDLQVESFSTISALRKQFSEYLPQGIVITVPLPDGSGYDLIEELRNKPEGHKPVIIVLGQHSGFLDKVQSIRSGADAFFEYPAEPGEVCKKLSYLLGRDKPEQYKILSVEDDPDQAAFIKLTLESAKYTVRHISDPKLFEETFLSFEPDLVLLDVMLGEMTGFDLARYIRQHERFAAVPIIFLTTQNKLHMHIRSARAGADDHLIKPVAPQLLIATIAGRLEKNRALKQLIDRDGLTRCLVYGSFMEKTQKMAAAETPRSSAALMMIDVDNLKLINDQYGYAAGDRILANISNLMLKGFRNTELIARYGNDQFAIVLEHLSEQQLSNLATQVIGTLSGWQHLIQGKVVQVTCSAGTAFFEQGMNLESWIVKAENALRQAKEQGKNQAVVMPADKSPVNKIS